MRDDERFGPCDCGEVELWAGNAEITWNGCGARIRHSRYQCREVKPKPEPETERKETDDA